MRQAGCQPLSARWAQEHVQASVEPDDLNVGATSSFPGFSSQAEADRAPRAIAPVPSGLPVFLVPDRTRGGEGGHIVLEGTAERLLRPEPGKGQVQDGLAHLPPQ